jgi:hypothetical protein
MSAPFREAPRAPADRVTPLGLPELDARPTSSGPIARLAVEPGEPEAGPRASTPRRAPPGPGATQPLAAAGVHAALEPPPRNTALMLVLAGIVALLLLGVVAAVLLRPTPTGILVVSVPPEVRGTAVLSINGEPVTEKDGSPIKDWPLVRQVRVGKAVVRVSAPGYESVVDTVEVKDGEPAELRKELRKVQE